MLSPATARVPTVRHFIKVLLVAGLVASEAARLVPSSHVFIV